MGSVTSQNGYVLPETVVLACLGLADLVVTCYLLASGHALEANPLMARVLENGGPIAMVVAKALSIAVPLAIAELARKRYPTTVRIALRAAIVAYAVLWFWGTARVNRWT
jgi:hypothetical protein